MKMVAIILSALCLVLFVILLLKSGKTDATAPINEAMYGPLQNELKENRTELITAIKNCEEQIKSLKDLSEKFSINPKDFNEFQKLHFDAMTFKLDELVKSTELKLEEMGEKVDEKLPKTWDESQGQSFKIVSERLEAVPKGLGEMHLGNILEQIMASEQNEAYVKTKQGSNGHGKEVYLPIDAKFLQEDYVRLQTAKQNNKNSLVASLPIENKIYVFRGQKLMVDRYLAMLYGIETKRLNEQVKINVERIPEEFMFQLTEVEFVFLKSQNAISNLKSQNATASKINIADAFCTN